ncbi:replication protein RepA [Streptococcus pneumoniae]
MTLKQTKKKELDSKHKAYSFCCVLNNVDKLFDTESKYFENFSEKTQKRVKEFRANLDPNINYTPEAIVDHLMRLWVDGKEEKRMCAANYEIADTGTHHCHLILEDKGQVRFSALQSLYPTIHAEFTRGTKEEVIEYLNKTGKHEEKAHTIVVPMKVLGELRANRQGYRSDLDYIQERLEGGATPEEIMSEKLEYRSYSKMIKEHYYQLRIKDTPDYRDVKVIYHTGDSGAGKSYTQVKLKEEHGREKVYIWSDYQNGGLDGYQGEPILFMEEYKGELPYAEFLKVTDRYLQQMHARYSNIFTLWEEIHITSIFSPKQIYNIMVPENKRTADSEEQMMRRINEVVYHFKVTTEDGEPLYKQIVFSVADYNNHSQEQIERFAYQFDCSNPEISVYNFENDAFYSTMNPVNHKKKKPTSKPRQGKS